MGSLSHVGRGIIKKKRGGIVTCGMGVSKMSKFGVAYFVHDSKGAHIAKDIGEILEIPLILRIS